jgi:hypothetical protein
MAVLGVCLGMALAACGDDDKHATSKLTHKTGTIVLAADTEHLAR